MYYQNSWDPETNPRIMSERRRVVRPEAVSQLPHPLLGVVVEGLPLPVSKVDLHALALPSGRPVFPLPFRFCHRSFKFRGGFLQLRMFSDIRSVLLFGYGKTRRQEGRISACRRICARDRPRPSITTPSRGSGN